MPNSPFKEAPAVYLNASSSTVLAVSNKQTYHVYSRGRTETFDVFITLYFRTLDISFEPTQNVFLAPTDIQ